MSQPKEPVFQDPPSIYDRPIREHGGGKYLRTIHAADGAGGPIRVDVYCVIEAFGITCPALQHALKKILACGQRGKGSKIDDIHGVFDAMWRALELQRQREAGALHTSVPTDGPRDTVCPNCQNDLGYLCQPSGLCHHCGGEPDS